MADLSKIKLNGTTYTLKDAEARAAIANIGTTGGAVTSVNGQTGAVTISIPTNVSSLNNDAGYLTLSTLPKYDGTVI